jgi:hypothetical protein
MRYGFAQSEYLICKFAVCLRPCAGHLSQIDFVRYKIVFCLRSRAGCTSQIYLFGAKVAVCLSSCASHISQIDFAYAKVVAHLCPRIGLIFQVDLMRDLVVSFAEWSEESWVVVLCKRESRCVVKNFCWFRATGG